MTLLLSNSDLLGRFRNGENDALTAVYNSYLRRVEWCIRRGLLLAGKNAAIGFDATVADLVQDVFAHAFSPSARLAYDGTREYGPLVLAMARNVLIDHLRRSRREELFDPIRLEQHLVREPPHNESGWFDPRTLVIVQRYVAALPEREYAVYVERFAHDKSQLQAAESLGLTRQQIRTLEGRVRIGLIRELVRAM